jgi:hypothetical protein
MHRHRYSILAYAPASHTHSAVACEHMNRVRLLTYPGTTQCSTLHAYMLHWRNWPLYCGAARRIHASACNMCVLFRRRRVMCGWRMSFWWRTSARRTWPGRSRARCAPGLGYSSVLHCTLPHSTELFYPARYGTARRCAAKVSVYLYHGCGPGDVMSQYGQFVGV